MTEIHYYVIRCAVNDPFVFDIAAALNGLRRSRFVNWNARILIDDGVCVYANSAEDHIAAFERLNN